MQLLHLVAWVEVDFGSRIQRTVGNRVRDAVLPLETHSRRGRGAPCLKDGAGLKLHRTVVNDFQPLIRLVRIRPVIAADLVRRRVGHVLQAVRNDIGHALNVGLKQFRIVVRVGQSKGHDIARLDDGTRDTIDLNGSRHIGVLPAMRRAGGTSTGDFTNGVGDSLSDGINAQQVLSMCSITESRKGHTCG